LGGKAYLVMLFKSDNLIQNPTPYQNPTLYLYAAVSQNRTQRFPTSPERFRSLEFEKEMESTYSVEDGPIDLGVEVGWDAKAFMIIPLMENLKLKSIIKKQAR